MGFRSRRLHPFVAVEAMRASPSSRLTANASLSTCMDQPRVRTEFCGKPFDVRACVDRVTNAPSAAASHRASCSGVRSSLNIFGSRNRRSRKSSCESAGFSISFRSPSLPFSSAMRARSAQDFSRRMTMCCSLASVMAESLQRLPYSTGRGPFVLYGEDGARSLCRADLSRPVVRP